ncbi:hypothetical protein RCOM_1134950 [Ricinus communis]|uniref:Uncharacterized protein n=1 Tax=Ricinus communis TaxID=3988 RepID=B9RVF2_RICCO|nr:hypothetical protein RCOM_1134950 [Ricinus communis]
MVKLKTIDSFFKKKNIDDLEISTPSPLTSIYNSSVEKENQLEIQKEWVESKDHPFTYEKIKSKDFDVSLLEHDPGLHSQIWEFNTNKKDEVTTSSVLEEITEDGSTNTQRGDVDVVAYKFMTLFEFVFILYLAKETMEVTNNFCQALQQKSQDIVNAMHLVTTRKTLTQKLREDGWDNLLNQNVKAMYVINKSK